MLSRSNYNYLVQLQIAVFDPAQLALHLAEHHAEHGGQYKAQQHHGCLLYTSLRALGVQPVALFQHDGAAVIGVQDVRVVPLDDFFRIYRCTSCE